MVVYAYYPHTETRVQRQAEALVARGFDVDVVCLRADGEQAQAQGSRKFHHPLLPQVVMKGVPGRRRPGPNSRSRIHKAPGETSTKSAPGRSGAGVQPRPGPCV